MFLERVVFLFISFDPYKYFFKGHYIYNSFYDQENYP